MAITAQEIASVITAEWPSLNAFEKDMHLLHLEAQRIRAEAKAAKRRKAGQAGIATAEGEAQVFDQEAVTVAKQIETDA
jgi:hypothetical protein